MNRNLMLVAGLGAAALGGAFAFGIFSSGDASASAGAYAAEYADSPVVTVYKSPT
jgi:hypothetical protein